MTVRIAVDARPLCAPWSGIGRYTHCILDELILKQPQPCVRWFLYADRPIPDYYSGIANVTIRTFNKHNRLLSLPRTQLTFSSWAMSDRAHAFWSPRHHLPLVLERSTRAIVTIHDLLWKLHPGTMQTANRISESLLMPRTLKLADRIICVSDTTRSALARYFPDVAARATVIPEGCTLPNYGSSQNADTSTVREYFLFVGTLEPRKNLRRVLLAFEQIAHLIPHDMVIVGSQGWGTELERFIRNMDSSSRIELTGQISDARLSALYGRATALILPSLYEGFGLTAVEAMRHGVPILGSTAGSLPEVIGDGGILVNPESVDAISRAMALLATDKIKHRSLADKALKRSLDFSWSEAARRTFDVLTG